MFYMHPEQNLFDYKTICETGGLRLILILLNLGELCCDVRAGD